MRSSAAFERLKQVSACCALLLAACATETPQRAPVVETTVADGAPRTAPQPSSRSSSAEQILARNERFLIYVPSPNDTLASIAGRVLGNEADAWIIAEFNDITEPKPGQPLVVPLRPNNPTGVFRNGYQTVPILCYHRFGPEEGKMVVSPKAFAQQMEFLKHNGYRPVRLADLFNFLQGKQALPRKAVVITMDDGYASMYHHAYPVLKQYAFPATVFVYTDFIGAKDALSWDQMQEMAASGLVDIQAHSKTHTSLALRLPGETDTRYRQRLDAETVTPREVLQRKLRAKVSMYAYPYGDTNSMVMEQLARADYKLAVTVDPGGNAFFTPSLLLRRTMILGDQDLESFKARLQVFNAVDLR
jgi:peptidoglycan/xylan/chitin deacetylase (PgdA/CDA1 family)